MPLRAGPALPTYLLHRLGEDLSGPRGRRQGGNGLSPLLLRVLPVPSVAEVTQSPEGRGGQSLLSAPHVLGFGLPRSSLSKEEASVLLNVSRASAVSQESGFLGELFLLLGEWKPACPMWLRWRSWTHTLSCPVWDVSRTQRNNPCKFSVGDSEGPWHTLWSQVAGLKPQLPTRVLCDPGPVLSPLCASVTAPPKRGCSSFLREE